MAQSSGSEYLIKIRIRNVFLLRIRICGIKVFLLGVAVGLTKLILGAGEPVDRICNYDNYYYIIIIIIIIVNPYSKKSI